MRVVWTDEAQRDAISHVQYIAGFNPHAAAGMLRRMHGAGNGLAAFPLRGRPKPDGTCELTLAYPYVIVYEVDENAATVTILRVWHGAQDRDGAAGT